MKSYIVFYFCLFCQNLLVKIEPVLNSISASLIFLVKLQSAHTCYFAKLNHRFQWEKKTISIKTFNLITVEFIGIVL